MKAGMEVEMKVERKVGIKQGEEGGGDEGGNGGEGEKGEGEGDDGGGGVKISCSTPIAAGDHSLNRKCHRGISRNLTRVRAATRS